MSEITLVNWIKTYPFLTEKIASSSIEDIFSNGYYFGKILQTQNKFQEMKYLKDSNDKNDIINNYIFLSKTFRKIGIELSEQDINDLMARKLHKAELYLFKIKQYLTLDKIQFREIVEKMDIENRSKIKDEIDLKNKRKNLYSRFKSATRRAIPIMKEKKESRLQSAKLPKISINPKILKNLNINKANNINNNKDLFLEENEKAHLKQMQAVINDIKIFENIHMKKGNGQQLNKLNPWDEISFIYDKKDLFKDKNKEIKAKLFKLLDKENKKENDLSKNKISLDDKLEKMKMTLNNYNQFMVDHSKKFLKKEDLEKGLSLMGLNTTYMFPSILKIKESKVPSELVMKSINDKNKIDIKNKTTAFFQKKINPPVSAREVYGDLKKKNSTVNQENKKKSYRAQTAKISKQNLNNKKIFSLKKSDNALNNKLNSLDNKNNKNKRPSELKEKEIKEIKKENKNEMKEIKESKKESKIEYINTLTKIEENEKISSYQNSIPSSIYSYVKTDEDELIKKETVNSKNKQKKKLTEEERFKLIEKRKKQYLIDTKDIKNVLSSIIDITEIFFDYQNKTGSEFIDLEKFNKVSYDFIHNKSLVKHHRTKKIKPKEEKIIVSNHSNINKNSQISNEKYSINFEEKDKNEMKNYLFNIGKKYDLNKNNLFIKKLGIKPANLEINDVMGDEIELLFNKIIAEGKEIEDEDNEEELRTNGKIKYRPNKEEQQILEVNYKSNITEYHFTNLISEVIKFVYDKEKEKEKNKELNEINNNEVNENKNENNNNNISIKDILISIPIKMSFIGLMNTEIKLIIKNSLAKYPKIKIYNPVEFLNELRLKKKKVDEPIDELNTKKFVVDQLKKEKNILIEEIKDYLDLLENKDNLTDDEICIQILLILIRKDFEKKNLENIKQEIIDKRESIKNINEKINSLKEEQNQGKRINPRDIDNLQQQINKIYSDSMIGFILINFPNNSVQSKLMEKYLMDLIQPCEQSISDFDIINDKLLFICDKELKNPKSVKFEPCLEKLILFYCDNNKLENVAPEFTKEKIDSYINEFKDMEEFYQNFNLKIDKYDYYEGIEEENNVILNNNNINMNSNSFIQRDKTIYEKLKSSLTIYEDKLVPRKINNTILADESYDEVFEEVIQMKEKESSRKISGDSSIKQPLNNSRPQLKINQKKDSENSSTLKNNETSRLNQDKEKITLVKNKYKQKTISLKQLSEEETFNIYKIWKDFVEQYNYHINKNLHKEKNTKSKKIEDELIEIQKNYIQFLVNPEKQKILVNQFIDKYKCFKNKFIKDKRPNKESYKIIIDNYQKDLIELNEAMWSVAKIKKNLAFNEIEKVEYENIIDKDLNDTYDKLEKLIILETEKLIVTINIFVRYFTLIFNPKYISTNNNIIPQFKLDSNLSEEILKDLDNEELAQEISQKSIIYPRANRLYKNTFRLLIKIYIFLDDLYNKLSIKDKKGNITSSVNKSIKSKKTVRTKVGGNINTQNSISSIGQFNPNSKLEMQNQIKSAIKVHIKKYKNKIYNIYMNALEDLSKIFCPFRQIIKLMDDWIILSMELQTNNINKTIKELDVTNNYTINNNNNNIDYEKVEKNIVDLIISENCYLYNYEFQGINPNEFILFDKKKFLGISDKEENNEKNINTDDDYYKIFEYIKEYDIILKLKNAEIQKGIITKDKFEEIFFKIGLFENIDKFPKNFRNLDYHNISKFLSHFTFLSSDFDKDKDNNDNTHAQKLLYTNDVLTILILSCIQVDKEKIEQKYNLIENNYINEESFMNNNYGFEDELIDIKNRTNLKQQIKSMLFNINKTGNEIPEINIKKYLELLLLKPIKDLNNEIVIGKYFDLFYN